MTKGLYIEALRTGRAAITTNIAEGSGGFEVEEKEFEARERRVTRKCPEFIRGPSDVFDLLTAGHMSE